MASGDGVRAPEPRETVGCEGKREGFDGLVIFRIRDFDLGWEVRG